MKLERPAGQFCYEPHLFGDFIECPDLDVTITKEPKCNKFDKQLEWNHYGRILKCQECLDEIQKNS